MTKKKAKWHNWLPHRPFNQSETIRDWHPLNLDWDDETVCALCGKSTECKCFDEYYCNCGLKNKDCKWPESVECQCMACDKLFVECVCDKPEYYTEEHWKSLKVLQYILSYNWDEDKYSHEKED